VHFARPLCRALGYLLNKSPYNRALLRMCAFVPFVPAAADAAPAPPPPDFDAALLAPAI